MFMFSFNYSKMNQKHYISNIRLIFMRQINLYINFVSRISYDPKNHMPVLYK